MDKLLNTIIFLGIVELTVAPAFAYLNPGTGSLIIQVAIAMFITISIFMKSFFISIKNFFIKIKNKKKDKQ